MPVFRLQPLWLGPLAWSALLILTALAGDLALADPSGSVQESAVTPDFGMMVRYVFWALIAVTGIAVAALLWSWLLGRRVAQRTRQLRRELNERRQVELALRESEARFRDVTEAASDWIWEMDDNLRFTYLSERFYALTGIAPQHVLGRARWELATGDSAAEREKWRRHRELLEQHLPFRDFAYQTGIGDRHGEGRYLKVSGKEGVSCIFSV